MTSAFSVPQPGLRMGPYSIVTITDREGNVIEETRPEPHEAIRADTAYVMTNLLRGVVARGTGGAAKHSTGLWRARPARSTSTPTPGSSASIRTSRSVSGWATTRRSRSAGERRAGGTTDLDGLHAAFIDDTC